VTLGKKTLTWPQCWHLCKIVLIVKLIKLTKDKFDILLTLYHYVSQQRNQPNTLSLSQTLYCVVILYMFRASSVHLQEALHF
jgi:hypothetical protein